LTASRRLICGLARIIVCIWETRAVFFCPMDYTPALEYISGYWSKLIRHTPHDQGTLIGLPQPYLVPSEDPIFREMFYWDSYFIALGLVETELEPHIFGMLENMAHLLHRFEVIPNGSRFYFLSRSQPPFLTQLIRLGLEVKQRRGDTDIAAWLEPLVQVAVQEHQTVWLGTQHPHHRLVHRGLSRYFDINYLHDLACCESGWDHSPRCGERWLEHVQVDLNSILYVRELDFAEFYKLLGQPEAATQWKARAEARAATMQDVFWDETQGFYFDFDYQRQTFDPYPSLAGFYPLWAGIATPEQAARVVEHWLPKFECLGGLQTALEPKAGFQWAAPNGWSPLQWLVVAGLERYGYHTEAKRIMRAWCDNNAAVFAKTGAFWEKYNVVHIGEESEGGLYGALKGFGWSNAVFWDFAKRLKNL
jgi:alpha,alpha-trehalase